MFKIWAIFSLFCGAVILAWIAWVFLVIIGKIIFEDLLVNSLGKIGRKKKRKEDDDYYVY
jgi:hypothetical protein